MPGIIKAKPIEEIMAIDGAPTGSRYLILYQGECKGSKQYGLMAGDLPFGLLTGNEKRFPIEMDSETVHELYDAIYSNRDFQAACDEFNDSMNSLSKILQG